jgi:hypothetical protein
MSQPLPFRFPFSPPSRAEAVALEQAAAYLLRAANEVETARIAVIGFLTGSAPLDDLPAALHAAGCLCDAVVESADGRV